MSNPPWHSLDTLAEAVARAWLDNRLDEAEAQAQADALLAAARRLPELGSLYGLSLGFHALRRVLMRRAGDMTALALTDKHLLAVRALACPRALAVAEAAWAWARVLYVQQRPALVALARTPPGPLPSTAGPALERIWPQALRSILLCVEGEHEQALVCGLQAQALAQAAKHAFSSLIVAQGMAFLYLSVGDVEGADVALAEAFAAQRDCGFESPGLALNQLLCLVLSRRFDAAQGLLDAGFAPAERSFDANRPLWQALVARVRQSQGLLSDTGALPLQPWEPWQPDCTEPHTLAANRLWVCADLLLARGQAAQARLLLEQGLRGFEAAGVSLLPMNATQLQRALADACEASGDLPAALAALRASQRHCFSWVGESLRARLQALHHASAQREAPVQGAEPLRRRQRRLDLVDRTLKAASANPAPRQAAPHRLLAQVTHEVRNPLHGVVWMTSLLMMSDLDERQREYLQLAQSSANTALALCNDVLDLARLEAGKLPLQKQPLDLCTLLHECTRLHGPAAQAKGLALHTACDPALPARVEGDRLRIQQVLMNLLSNAIKFTERGRIDLRATWTEAADAGAHPPGCTVRLSVADTGPGLSEELLPRLFEEFEQAASSAAAGGAGLGLALCKQLVRLMDGELGFDNRPGLGCKFWFDLPLPAVQ